MRVLVIILVGLFAFIGGFIGVASLLSPPTEDPPTTLAADSVSSGTVTAALVKPTAVGVPNAIADSTAIVGNDSASVALPAVVASDSIMEYRAMLAEAKRSRAALEARIEALTATKEKATKAAEEVTALSATLPKLEPAELKAILAQVDMVVLEMLYEQASSRNRTTILQALSPERAATFVHRLVKVPKTPTGTTSTEPGK